MVAKSMKFGDKEYRFVPDRIKQFREENPNGDIDTNSTINPDGSVTFKAVVVKDRNSEGSARGSGTARYTENEMKKPKAFEKLETISIGRALSTIGYLNNGEVASSEEMEEFLEFQNQKIADAIESLNSAENLEQLKKNFMMLGSLMADKAVIEAKDKKKAELNENN